MNHHSEQVIGNTLCKKLLTENSSIPLQTNKKNKIKLYVIICSHIANNLLILIVSFSII